MPEKKSQKEKMATFWVQQLADAIQIVII